MNAVSVRAEALALRTYLPAPPDKNPMFLEKRVYQGSSGRVYPLPFTDRIADTPVVRKWKAIWIENEFLRVLVLPELGGRIHRIIDKTNGYDLIYHQEVIKPALVGLAGPWISGGIEFNWPQHHRPATFLPVASKVERNADGSVTVWCSDHDPMCRMKGMHGVCLHPDKAFVEIKVRAYNRTPLTQTFLWWANVATRVHEAYQSFFPPDVHYVADHAKRAMTEYPMAQGHYYGVDYGKRGRKGVPANEQPQHFRPPHLLDAKRNTQYTGKSEVRSPKSEMGGYAPNDLSFYANIPVPTSYMCMDSQGDFCGGYDYKAQSGIVHLANHHISPGKKQWTWGNHEFGYAWDRNLTNAQADGEFSPYIELMAGVYTDNQPDFSFLQPGETKTWSQYWYPIQKIGPAQHANLNAAVRLKCDPGRLQVGVSVTSKFLGARIEINARGRMLYTRKVDLAPGAPSVKELKLPRGVAETDLLLRVMDSSGNEIISWQPRPRVKGEAPAPATEPPAPGEIASNDELFLTGLHLDQYRHATRSPLIYWREALRRDPLDSRCNNAMGLWHLKRGEFADAEECFRKAIQRLTRRNPNPHDGEAYYNLGLTLRLKADATPQAALRKPQMEAAYDAFYKACWNQAWMAAGYHALAEIDCCRQHWSTALEHLNRSLRFDTDNLRARDLKVIVLRKLSRNTEAKSLLRDTLKLDPLDWWARHLSGGRLTCDAPTHVDIAHDCARAGLLTEAIELLESVVTKPGDLPDQNWGALPLVHYTLGWLLLRQAGQSAESRPGKPVLHLEHKTVRRAKDQFLAAAKLSADYCFPSRLEDIAVLEAAMRANPRDARAPYYLGNLLYDRRRHEEAIRRWEEAAKLDPGFSIVWRNLGIGYFNIHEKPAKARTAYDKAFRANPDDARLLYERDQLWKRLGEKPEKRLRQLQKRLDLVQQRDDLSVELCALYNQTGQHEKALELVSARNFQPWEGGEGGPLGQWVRSHLMLGRKALCGRKVSGRGTAVGQTFLSAGSGDFPVAGSSGPTTGLESPVNRQAGKPALQSAEEARRHFEAALTAPRNLGEAKHLLANQSDIHYWLGCAVALLGDARQAKQHWLAAARFKGDFQEMSVRAFSEMTYYSALAWVQLGQRAKAKRLFRDLLNHARQLQTSVARIDYFATSLPAMLIFEDDLKFRQETTALFLQAQAFLGLGQKSKGRAMLTTVLKRDPNHALAADLKQTLPTNTR